MLTDGFNEECKNIASSYLKVGDEYMSAISFWTTEKGDLPHLTYIFHKTEPLGIEFNTLFCSVTGYLIFIEVHISKEGKNHRNYQHKIEATAACTKRMVEATKGIGQK